VRPNMRSSTRDDPNVGPEAPALGAFRAAKREPIRHGRRPGREPGRTERSVVMGGYAEAFRRSLDDPEGFWREAAQQIDWYQAPASILDASNPLFYRWFSGGGMETCFYALDPRAP